MPILEIPFARLGYPHLREAVPIMTGGRPKGEPRYTVELHLNDSVTLADGRPLILTLQQEIVAAAEKLWPDPARRPPCQAQPGGDPTLWRSADRSLRLPLVWGPAENPDDAHAVGWILKAAAKQDAPPYVMRYEGNVPAIIGEHEWGLVYPGAEAHVNLSIYAYADGGVACGLNGVLLTGRDLGRFDSRPSASQMFGGLPGPNEMPAVPGAQHPTAQTATPQPPANPSPPTANPFGTTGQPQNPFAPTPPPGMPW